MQEKADKIILIDARRRLSASDKTTMHPNSELITKLYTAFGNRDASGMSACYHTDVEFSDEVFPDLKGKQAGAMWQMWSATTSNNWITISSGTGTGDGFVTYTVAPNTTTSPRTGVVEIGARILTINQARLLSGAKPFDFDSDGKSDVSVFRYDMEYLEQLEWDSRLAAIRAQF